MFLSCILFVTTIRAQQKQSSDFPIHIIKLGGSVITQKGAATPQANNAVIESIAQQIATFLHNNPNHRIIIVHGGGSFAHPPAKKHKLHLGIDKTNKHAVMLVHDAMKQINKILVDALNNAGVMALPVHPMSCVVCKNGKIEHIHKQVLLQLLQQNFVPVLHGDLVVDTEKGICILSGDQITPYLAKQFSISCAGLASCQDGVYDNAGNVVPEITDDNFEQIRHFLGSSEHVDVTGGMMGKILELLSEQAPPSSCIFNGQTEKNVLRFLKGETIGTIIVKRQCFF